MNRILVIASVVGLPILIAGIPFALAQQNSPLSGGTAAPRPSFEVASIKLHTSDDRRFMIRPEPGGRFQAAGVPLKMLIGVAYRLQDYQISGGPNWIESERYDIVAKTDDGANAKWMECLQSLLEDRFKLTTHRETKEMPTYALMVAKGGSKLHESEGECPPRPANLPPPPAPGQLPKPPCGGMFGGRGQFFGEKVPLDQMVMTLARMLGRPVVDKTGLTGRYDINLAWTPDQNDPQFAPGGPPSPEPPSDASGPTIYTALQEQLGLRLVSQKGPVEVLTIDHADHPSEN